MKNSRVKRLLFDIGARRSPEVHISALWPESGAHSWLISFCNILSFNYWCSLCHWWAHLLHMRWTPVARSSLLKEKTRWFQLVYLGTPFSWFYLIFQLKMKVMSSFNRPLVISTLYDFLPIEHNNTNINLKKKCMHFPKFHFLCGSFVAHSVPYKRSFFNHNHSHPHICCVCNAFDPMLLRHHIVRAMH